MTFEQRKLNEFLVDLVEFVQKHFRPPVTRTKVLEENGCAGILMKHEPSGCEIEIGTLGGKVTFKSGSKAWIVEAAKGPSAQAELFAGTIRELLAVFAGQRVGPWGSVTDPAQGSR